MDHDEIIKEIEFVVDAVQDGACFALVDSNRGTDLSDDLSRIIGDLLTDYLDREG